MSDKQESNSSYSQKPELNIIPSPSMPVPNSQSTQPEGIKLTLITEGVTGQNQKK